MGSKMKNENCLTSVPCCRLCIQQCSTVLSIPPCPSLFLTWTFVLPDLLCSCHPSVFCLLIQSGFRAHSDQLSCHIFRLLFFFFYTISCPSIPLSSHYAITHLFKRLQCYLPPKNVMGVKRPLGQGGGRVRGWVQDKRWRGRRASTRPYNDLEGGCVISVSISYLHLCSG